MASPLDTPDSKLEAIVRKRHPGSSDRHRTRSFKCRGNSFVSGETLPYLGRNVRLVVEPADVPSPEVRFDHWSFRIVVPFGLDESKRYAEIRKAIVRWYRQRAAQRLPRTVELCRKRMGWPESPEVLVRDQRQRWGSCAPTAPSASTGVSVMVHPELAEYVVLHELAHLKVSSHSADYWALVPASFLMRNNDANGSEKPERCCPYRNPKKCFTKEYEAGA